MASATTSEKESVLWFFSSMLSHRITTDILKAGNEMGVRVFIHILQGDLLEGSPCRKDQDICDEIVPTSTVLHVKVFEDGSEDFSLFKHIPKALVKWNELRLMFGGAKYKQQSNLVTLGWRYYGLAMAAKQPIRREKSAEKLWELLASEKFKTVQEIKNALTTHGYPEDQSWNTEPAGVQGGGSKMISGVYGTKLEDRKVQIKMEHCALNGRRSQWTFEVKGRLRQKQTRKGPTTRSWSNILDLYPNAKVEVKDRNSIILTLDPPDEYHEFAVFGLPKEDDKKRMQMGLFGEKPVQGQEWKIWAILFDDTMMAFKHVCEMQEHWGRQLLTTLSGLFVSNNDEDIKIVLSSLESGWQIKGRDMKTVASKDAWNSPENSTDFPCCYFDITHEDRAKRSFFCAITASHGKDNAKAKVVAFYEEEKSFSPRMKKVQGIMDLSP